MTLKLILIRHAKSDWDSFAQDDHLRPLSTRGRRQAPMIGQWLAERGHVPDEIMSSDARRTRETCALVFAKQHNPPPTFSADLYLASAPVILTTVQTSSAATLAIVGHNPGIGDFADIMCTSPPVHTRFADYPTGATTVMVFDEHDWSDVQLETGTMIDFTIPADLE